METRVTFNDLSPARSEDEYAIHCAAVEWSLTDPIIINSATEIKSRVDWGDKVEPFYHQVQNLMRFCRRLPVTLLADDVGLGKTISAGLIISELMKRGRVSRVFVICPKILIPQWIEEMQSKFGIQGYGAVGAELEYVAKRPEPVVATTYQSATRFLTKKTSGVFDMLILDEAHKVRNLYGKPGNAPKMALAIHQALEARMFRYVLMLTATPIQNRLWDIYSLVDCLAVAKGHRNPFGSPDDFASRYLADGRLTARKLNEAYAKEFRQIVRNYMSRTRRSDAKLLFPDREVTLYRVSVPEAELRLHKLMAKQIDQFNPLVQSSLLVALMSSPQALVGQLENMAERDRQYEELADLARMLKGMIRSPAKLNAILKIAAHLRGQKPRHWRMVVFTTRRESQRMIVDSLESEGVRCGIVKGGEHARNRKAVDAFCDSPPSINVLVSTDAGAEGINLQSANILVNYDLPWNPMIVEQRIGRVQRIGSEFKKVWVANVVHADSPEEHIVARLLEKLQVISHTVGDIESVLEATGDRAGDGKSFEKQIREMVIRSLQGQDTSKAAQLAEASIDNAKRLFEKQQDEIDKRLGGADDEDEEDVPMPRVQADQPSVPIEDFVTRAFTADGATIHEEADGLYRSARQGVHDDVFTFDKAVWQKFSQDGVFMGRAPLLFQPGAPAFERLVQKWCDRASLLVDNYPTSNEVLRQSAAAWAKQMPNATIETTRVFENSKNVGATLLCKARISNSVDSYEKLLHVDVESHVEIDSETRSHNVDVAEIFQHQKSEIVTAIKQDGDLRVFYDYYAERLHRELAKSDSGSRREALILDLRPTAIGEIVGAKCRTKTEFAAEVNYRFPDSPSYTSVLRAGARGAIVTPQLNECGATGWTVPDECLDECVVSGKRALRHLLVASELSGQLAMTKHVLACEVSGRKVLETEIEKCAITEQRVSPDLLVTSEMSGRRAIQAKNACCDITGAIVLMDELVESSRSGRSFRKDEAVELSSTGGIAHKSEATWSPYTAKWYVPELCVRSAVTGDSMPKSEAESSDRSGRVAHASELVKCEVTGRTLLPDETVVCQVTFVRVDNSLVFSRYDLQWYPPDECERSAVTGDLALKTELRESDKSGKRAHTSEIVTCEVTGKSLLPAETQTCEVTGRRVDKDLLFSPYTTDWHEPNDCIRSAVTGDVLPMATMVRSAISGRPAHVSEIKYCAVTDVLLLPDEAGICAHTKKIVDRDLLRVCPDSKQSILASEMVECEWTHVQVAPSEIVECVITGKKIRKVEAGVSAASGRHAIVEKMVKCEGTDALLLPTEVNACRFSGMLIDKRYLQACRVTGVRVYKALLNESGEFAYFRQCLNGEIEGEVFPDQTLMSQFSRKRLAGVTDLRWVTSSDSSNVHIFFGWKSFFGFGKKRFAVVSTGDLDEGFELEGNLVFAEKVHGAWYVSETIDSEEL